jgi:hypothetical protein
MARLHDKKLKDIPIAIGNKRTLKIETEFRFCS